MIKILRMWWRWGAPLPPSSPSSPPNGALQIAPVAAGSLSSQAVPSASLTVVTVPVGVLHG